MNKVVIVMIFGWLCAGATCGGKDPYITTSGEPNHNRRARPNYEVEKQEKEERNTRVPGTQYKAPQAQ